jgi:hypothetical protein
MGADLWCQQDIALPQDAPVGKPFTLYWVWDWPTAPNVDPALPDGKEEIYTTCIDIDIMPKDIFQQHAKAKGQKAKGQKAKGHGHGYVLNQPLNSAAIPSQMTQLDAAAVIPSNPNPPSTAHSLSASMASQPGISSVATEAVVPPATVTATVTVTGQYHII